MFLKFVTVLSCKIVLLEMFFKDFYELSPYVCLAVIGFPTFIIGGLCYGICCIGVDDDEEEEEEEEGEKKEEVEEFEDEDKEMRQLEKDAGMSNPLLPLLPFPSSLLPPLQSFWSSTCTPWIRRTMRQPCDVVVEVTIRTRQETTVTKSKSIVLTSDDTHTHACLRLIVTYS